MIEIEAVLLAIALLLLGGYSLWDMYRVSRESYVSDDLLEYRPDPEDTSPQKPGGGLERLHQINEDVVGWLTVPDTSIDYPLLRGADDMYYLNRDVYKEFTLSGSIFLSCLNSPDLTEPYLLTYGHNMASGAMYADVTKFTDESYFLEHTEGVLTGMDVAYDIQFFAVVCADAYDEDYYGVTQINGDPDIFSQTLEKISHQTVVHKLIEVSPADQIIALSTCSEAETNGRIILFGKLVKKS